MSLSKSQLTKIEEVTDILDDFAVQEFGSIQTCSWNNCNEKSTAILHWHGYYDFGTPLHQKQYLCARHVIMYTPLQDNEFSLEYL